jgi:two-component system, LuxR family, sensor kinase FixL
MTDLSELLSAEREPAVAATAQRLQRAECPRVAQTRAGGAGAILDAMAACGRLGGDAPARAWAAAMQQESADEGLMVAEVLRSLHCVERAVRFHALKSIDLKKTLLAVLDEAGAALERLRQAYLAAAAERSAGGPDRQLAEALEEVRARKNAILESALDPIVTINHEGIITEFNRAAEQVFGHPRLRVLGTKPSEVLFPPAVSVGREDRIDRYLESGEGSMLGRRIEVTAVRADGEPFPAEMAMTIGQEQGAPVLTFFIRDISRRKKAEEEQAHWAEELERSNQELEQFAYVASHDLQEPLRKIRMFSDRLEVKCGGQLDETGRECIQRMQSAAARMQTLIDGLLTLSRVTTRARNFVPVDLAQVVREVVSDLEGQIERVGGRVEVEHLPSIQADPLQMRQLFQNLVGNALKFHRVDEPPVVWVRGAFVHGRQERRGRRSPADERCRIEIEDNGIGFEEKHADRIFGVFQRLHPRDVYEGTGVGLAICRRIVERHGGTIRARSAPGKGSAFEVILPVVQPKNKSESAP